MDAMFVCWSIMVGTCGAHYLYSLYVNKKGY